jgi:hypothetical protein
MTKHEKEMRSAVMSALARDGVRKRHKGKTKRQISEYYSSLRMGVDSKARK